MTGELVAVAQAVVDELNAGSFSKPFTAERSYRPTFELADMKTLHVTVVPNGVVVSGLGRNQSQLDYRVDVAVQQRLKKADLAEIDALMALVQEVAEVFRFKRLAGHPQAAWVRTEHRAVYAPEHMEELRQFTSVFTLTFRAGR